MRFLNERCSKVAVTYGIKLLGILLFVHLLQRINREQFLALLHSVSPVMITCCFFILLGIQTLKVFRWQFFCRHVGVHASFWETWKKYHQSLFIGIVTPGRVGELLRAEHLHNKGVARLTGISLVVAERSIDLLIVLLLAAAGAGFLFGWEWGLLMAVGAAGGVIALALLLLALGRLVFLRQVRELFASVSILPIILLTVLVWIVSLFWAVLIARAVGITAPVLFVGSAFSISCLFSVLPITIAGLGTRDMTLFVLLHPFGVLSEQSVAFSLLIFILLLAGGLPGGWFWLRKEAETMSVRMPSVV